MRQRLDKGPESELPPGVVAFIRQVTRKMRYRRKVRQEVQAELTAHFADELKDCRGTEEKEQKVRRLIEEFGDVRLLAILCRRAKKRCRPLWAKMAVRVLQTAAVVLFLLTLYMIWFVSGRPNVKVDYLALLNRMGRPEIAERDNAWPHYERAVALFVEPGDELELMPAFRDLIYPERWAFGSLSDETRETIGEWVQANRAAWEQFLIAASKPYCSKSYAYNKSDEEKWLLSVLLPHVPVLRGLTRVGVWRSYVSLKEGRTREALEDCLAMARAAPHWQHSGTVIEQLMGLALSRMAHEQILAVIAGGNLSAAELGDLQAKLAGIYPGSFPPIDLEGERLAFFDTVQHVFTDGGPGGGHLVARASGNIPFSGSSGNAADAHDLALWQAVAVVHAGRDQTVAKACRLFDRQDEYVKLSPHERRARGAAAFEEMLTPLPFYRYALIHVMLPAADRAADRAFRGKALHEATLTILALQRYHAEKESYPASLSELVRAGYLDTVPADPHSDGPLVYKTTGEGFILYSIGRDFEDDSGTPGKDRKGRPERWDSDGDAVFWPVRP